MNKTDSYELCIVVPIYNEEGNMLRLEKELSDYISTSSVSTCILLVDDGSKDKSRNLIQDICNRNESFFYLLFDKNTGLSAAIKAGIDMANSPYVGYIDADLQTTPKDFELLLPFRNDYELITGIRVKRKDNIGKKVTSKIANGFRRVMTKDGATDTGCPLKIIKNDYAKRIPFFKGMHRFLPALILLQDGKVKQIPVRHFVRRAGKSKFHTWNRLIGTLVDCFAYRWMKKRYINYKIESDNIS